MASVPTLLERLERYYDTVPRHSARTEEIGPFTLFVATEGFPFHARPALDGAGPHGGAALRDVLARLYQKVGFIRVGTACVAQP
jgi:hypothetical protein